MSPFRALYGLYLLLSTLACAPVKSDDERVIAVSRGRTIAYVDIRCPKSFRSESSERCRQREQESIRTRIVDDVIECAAEVGKITLTAHEVKEIEVQVAAERADVQRMTDRHLAVLRAVLRVQEGEKLDDVANSAGAGIRRQDIETQMRYLDDADATRQALAEDYLVAAAAATRAEMRRTLLVKKLRTYIAERTRATGRTEAEEEQALVESAVRGCGIRVIDSHYQMPNLRGVFKAHVQEIQLR